ncbi:MAG TPA: VWA domain-containing protein [Anaeromyxobacteraceae bacterium]|nr:VWA domain-containing protein [Anaeromyxobacteraceae bacterium]
MDARLVELARLLRQNGVRISTDEMTVAAQAVALVGVDTRDALRTTLRATLVKRAADVPLFERLFERWASGLGPVLDGIDRNVLEELLAAGLLDGEDPVASRIALDRALASLSPLAQAVLAGDRRGIARMLQSASLQLDFSALSSGSQVAFYGRRLLAGAGGAGVAGELGTLRDALARAGAPDAALALLSARTEEAIRALEQAARRWVELEQRTRAEARRQDGLLAFAAVTRSERERIDAAVRALAERLKARIIRRERSRRRGALNVRRTLRRNLGLGGFPAQLSFKQRRPERPDVVVLCDVSDSVRHVSRVMLLFVHQLQTVFRRVRSFVFVSEIAEVTQAFEQEPDVAKALEAALGPLAATVTGNSNYGRALKLFHERHLAAVSRRTTVVIIGDGRTNYHPPNAWVLRELRRRARRVLWICPEEHWAWGQGDSEMPTYAAGSDRTAVVTRLADLARVADELVPR